MLEGSSIMNSTFHEIRVQLHKKPHCQSMIKIRAYICSVHDLDMMKYLASDQLITWCKHCKC